MSNFTQADTYAHSPYVEITRVGSQAIVANTFTKVEFDNVVVNESGAWSSVNHTYSCLKAGRLQINACVLFADMNAATVLAFIIDVVVANSAGTRYKGKRLYQVNDVKVSYANIGAATSVPVNFGDSVWLEVYTWNTAANLKGTFATGGLDATHATFYYLT